MHGVDIKIDSGIYVSIEIDVVIKSDVGVDFWHRHMVLILIALVE